MKNKLKKIKKLYAKKINEDCFNVFFNGFLREDEIMLKVKGIVKEGDCVIKLWKNYCRRCEAGETPLGIAEFDAINSQVHIKLIDKNTVYVKMI